MPELDYPVFVDGQTLTHTELNDLRDFLDSQDTALGRTIGFGVNCGLDVTIDGGDYVIQPGLAIDQLGRPIMLEESVRLPLNSDRGEFDWLPEGSEMTVVLRLEEVVEDAVDCEEDGCIGHASLVHRRPVVEVAEGCLPPAGFTVEGSELSSVNPMTVTKTSRASNTGSVLANTLSRVLADRGFSAARHDHLATAIIESDDLPGVAAWKAAFLNQVYFATLEFLRCEALTSITCLRTTETPGVALGCNDDGRWDCQRRHHWEPPAGLSISLAGADCDDPCKHHRRRIEGLIDTFALPEVPAPDDPPLPGGGGPYVACNHPVGVGYGSIRDEILTLSMPCFDWIVPPAVIDEFNPKYEIDPDVFVNWPTESYRVDEFYPGTIDPIGVGTIGIGNAIGAAPAEAALLIGEAIVGFDGAVNPTIRTVSEAEVSGLHGYQPGIKAAVTDEIVLVEDSVGKVVTTGRIPVNETLNNIGGALADTAIRVDAAEVVANEASTLVTSLGADVTDLDQRTTDLDAILVGTIAGGGLIDRVSEVEGQLVIHGSAVSESHLNARVDGAVNQLRSELASGLSEVRDDIITENGQLRVELDQRWSRNDTRIDQVLQRSLEQVRPGFNQDLVATFRSMSEVLASSVADDDDAAQTALREIDQSISRLDAVAGGEELVAVFEQMAEVARSGGASRSSLTGLRSHLDAFRDSIG